MIIHEITEECFKKYGKVIDSIDLTELVSTMQTTIISSMLLSITDALRSILPQLMPY